jgi:hypothetical protein
VTYNKNGQVEGVKYDRIAVVLLNAVKVQQAQINRQAEQIQSQQRAIAELKKLLGLRRPPAKMRKAPSQRVGATGK